MPGIDNFLLGFVVMVVLIGLVWFIKEAQN